MLVLEEIVDSVSPQGCVGHDEVGADAVQVDTLRSRFDRLRICMSGRRLLRYFVRWMFVASSWVVTTAVNAFSIQAVCSVWMSAASPMT